MAFILADRVRETASAPGTGTVTLLGAVTGYQTFSAGIGANNTTYYVIADQSGTNWEVGLGTIGAGGTTLARTTVLSSSNSGSLVNFSSGTQDVFCDYPAGKAVYKDASNNVTGYAISGGTIDNTPIGATTASTGAFTYASTNSTTSTTPVLSFNGSNTNLASGATVSSSYLQNILQNKSGTAGASTNYVLSNDLGTDSSYYGEFGMNSSVYSSGTPADFFSINNGVYFSGHDGDISVGSGNGYKTYLTFGTSGQSAHVINASGALGLSTNLGTTPALSGTTGYGTSGQVLTSAGSAAAPTWSSAISPSQVLINQSYDQGTGVLQVTGQSTFNGAVTDKSLNLQGGNNYDIYSQDFTQTNWTKNNITVSGVFVTDPFGGTNAQLVTANAGTTAHNIQTASYTLPVGTYTQSYYLKYVNNPWIAVTLYDGSWKQATFNLQTGLKGTSITAGVTSSIVAVGNGYYRCSITLTTTTTAINSGIFFLASDTTVGTYTTSGTEQYNWFGAQLELGTQASAYTPTTTAAVTTTNNISVPSGQILISDGTSGLPSFTFISGTGTGLSKNGGGGITVSGSGNAYQSLNYNLGGEVATISTGRFAFSSNSNPAATPDLTIYRDAANTLAQRNSTNAQTFRLYNTYTDASNYERLSIDWSTTANTATIVTQNAGTGSARNLALGTSGRTTTVNGSFVTVSDASINGVTVGLGGGAVGSNTALANGALSSNSTGSNLTASGQNALFRNTTGSYSCAYGVGSLQNNTIGSNSCAYGYYSQFNNISGGNNSSLGGQSLQLNTTASNLTAIGTQALNANTTNVATLGTITGGTGYTNGTYTGVVMTLSSGSTALTYPTATIVVSGGAVTTVTLTSNGIGFKDTTTVLTAPAASIGGTGSGFSVPVATLASGTGNVAVGYQAGYSNTTGTNNTFSGYQAGFANTTGNNNTAFGNAALSANTTGTSNTANGINSLLANTTGGSNTAYGVNSLLSNTTGSTNTAFGRQSGSGNGSANANTTGSNNTYLGYQTVGSANNNTNEMVIGYQAVGLGSNTTVIGNTSTTLTQTYGVTKSTNYTVATLPSASTSGVGARAFVTDALAPSFGATVVTGGAVATPVYSDGTNWKVG